MERLIDTHCHLDFGAYADDLDAVLNRAAEAGVERIIVPAVDLPSCQTVLELARRFDQLCVAMGVHPTSTAGWQDGWLDEIQLLAIQSGAVAIGEIGLDYYWDRAPKQDQLTAFNAQLALAAELGLPVIVHNRQSDQDVLACLREANRGPGKPTGVLHSFSASWPVAVAALDMGYYLGFTGPITFKKAEELREVAARVPMERLLVETDGPFLAPHPYRGKRNEPACVRHVAERLAELKKVSLAEMARQTSANAAALFGQQVAVTH